MGEPGAENQEPQCALDCGSHASQWVVDGSVALISQERLLAPGCGAERDHGSRNPGSAPDSWILDSGS